MDELERCLEVAVTAALAAGRRTLAHFHPDVVVEVKADDTPVTIADREAETVLRDVLERTFPGHGVVGEEYGASRPGASHQWYLDPIDGTKSFLRGVPLYAVLVGLEVDGRVEVGVAHFPALRETLAAATGLGTRLNGRRVAVRDTRRLADAFVSFTDAASFARYGRERAWRSVQAATAHRPGWSDAFGHALVASGRVEVMLDPVMSAWDAGPFPVLLREAGGIFGDWSGVETIHGGEGVSCTLSLWPELAPLLAQRDDGDAAEPAEDAAEAD
jgi:histidinol-phosphatase